MFTAKKLSSCALLVVACVVALAFADTERPNQENERLLRDPRYSFEDVDRIPPPNYIPKRPGRYTREDWATVIDETWGFGLPTEYKIERFNQVSSTLTHSFACFHDLDFTDSEWFSLCGDYLGEISAGVSRGRMAGILGHFARRLKELHTYCDWAGVRDTELLPGVPLMWFGCNTTANHFGAAVTPTLAGEPLVYDVAPDHPLELEPGDIILGYDGVPWSQLAAELVDAELPITGQHIPGYAWYWGSNESCYNHYLQGAAGMNWHLFDEIDILKYASGDTVSFPTSLLVDADLTMGATEQLPIPGVPFPDWQNNHWVSSGVIPYCDQDIGYIYLWQWVDDADAEFDAAILDLWESDALIIDLRYNAGGWFDWNAPGFARLFNTTVEYYRWATRCGDLNDLYSMCPHVPSPNHGFLYGDPETYFDKPIAVLLGPACVSMGDMSALLLRQHPKARFFGQTSSMSPNPNVALPSDFAVASGRYAWCNTYLPQDFPPDQYVTHYDFEVDEIVWLTPGDVALGIDTVVEAALAWLCPVGVCEPVARVATLGQNHPNPFNPQTTITFTLARPQQAELAVYDLTGRLLGVLVDRTYDAGSHAVEWNGIDAMGRAVPSGTYVVRLETDSGVEARKVMLIR